MEEKTIAQIRAMSGTLADDFFYVTDNNQEGVWKYDSSDTSSADNTGTVLVTADGKRIKRVYDGPVHTKWFGFQFGGTDETALLRSVIENFKNVYLDPGIYSITPTHGSSTGSTFYCQSDSIIEFAAGAAIYCLNSGLSSYEVFAVYAVNNVKLIKPVIKGDRDVNTSGSGEWGMLIDISSTSSNITIIGGELWNAWGDGIYIDGGNTKTAPDTGVLNVNIDGAHIYNCRRQGISVITGRNITIENCIIHNINGTDPQSAIDIEPDNSSGLADTININNCIAYNCKHGFVCSGTNITYANCQIYNMSSRGFWFAGGDGGKNITITNCIINGTGDEGIFSSGVPNTCITNVIADDLCNTNNSEGLWITGDNLTFIGNKISNTPNGNLFRTTGTKGIIADNIFTTGKYGIRMDRSDTVVSGNIISGTTTGVGISSGDYTGNIFSKNNIFNCAGGMSLAGTNIIINDSIINNNSSHGINYTGTASVPNIKIQNNKVYNNNGTGIKDPGFSTIEDNLIYLNGSNGIDGSSIGNSIIRGNTIYDNAQTAGTSAAISIKSGADHTIIQDNQLRPNTGGLTYQQRYGIYINSGATDTKVIDNDIQTGCGTSADYSDNGTNTVFRSY